MRSRFLTVLRAKTGGGRNDKLIRAAAELDPQFVHDYHATRKHDQWDLNEELVRNRAIDMGLRRASQAKALAAPSRRASAAKGAPSRRVSVAKGQQGE